MSLDQTTGDITDALTDAEYADLEELETTIEMGKRTFVEVGNALAEIRDRKLYRQYHASFDAYCRDQWEMAKTKAYGLIQAAEVVADLSAIADTPVPANEGQARALTPLADDPEQAAAAMRAASEDGPPTAAKIADEVEKRRPAPKPPADPEPDPDREMDARQKKAADAAHALADRLSQYELVHERTIGLMEARCKRWRNQ